jgi:serine/threonine-protein kinase
VPRPQRDPVGTVLAGRYEVTHELGEESLGKVWAARDLKTGGLVQVKVLLPEVATDPVRFARFGREMTASFLVTHPNTVEVLDYGSEDGLHFLVLEYVNGRTLTQVLNEEGPISIERAAAITAQVVSALGAAHQEGVLHRALSPDKVVLLANAVDGDFVKVLDFGMAKLSDEEPLPNGEEQEVTATGLRVGDPRYMPPEYVATGAFTGKGDLYAAGGLLFHLVAGRPPFEGTRAQLLTQNVSAAAPLLSSVADGIPPWLDELVRDMLGKTPEHRPGVHKVVARLQDGLGYRFALPELIPLDSDGNVPPPSAPPAPAGSRWPVMAIMGAVIVCTGAVTVVLVAALIVVVAYVWSVRS